MTSDPTIAERQKPDPPIRYTFEELRNRVAKRFPDYVTNHIDTLYRGWWNTSYLESTKGSASIRHILSSLLYIERDFLQQSRRRFAPPAFEHDRTLLVPFVPFRSDYQPLIYLVTNELCERKLNVVVLVTADEYNSDVDHDAYHPNTEFCIVDRYYTLAAYLRAKRRFREIKPTVERLCDTLDLSTRQRHNTRDFYREYCTDWTVFEAVLAETCPDLLYNIHYLNNPGYVRALDEHDPTVPNVIIQHGINSGHPFGIFRAADVDLAVFWGTYFERKLDTYLVPTPDTVQIGNPKLELVRSEVPVTDPGAGILYVPTKMSCEGAPEALEFFAELAAQHGWPVTYKPHPRDDAQTLAAHDTVDPEQIVEDRSLYELIADAKVVVGFRSTGLIEAVALDRVALQVRPSDAPEDWTGEGLLGSADEREIATEVSRLLTDEAYYDRRLREQETVRDWLFGDLENASARIADLLYGMLPSAPDKTG
jgi:hypothetical protein